MLNYIEVAQQRIADNYPHIVYAKPDPRTLEAGTILGSWAYSLPHKYRIITNKERELASGVLPADVTRAWIQDVYKLPFRRRKSQLNRTYNLPIHALVGDWGDCAYVDIRHAYLSILSLGYDIEYELGKYVAVDPKPIPPEIANNKFCYSIAVAMSTTTISSVAIVSKEQSIFNVKKFNIYSNPCLYAFASDLLNAVCSEVLAVMGNEIKYANCDGFVVTEKHADALMRIIGSWNLEARIKHRGNTAIGGVGSWKIGESQTKRFDRKAHNFTCELATREERLWLKKRWVKLSQSVGALINRG